MIVVHFHNHDSSRPGSPGVRSYSEAIPLSWFLRQNRTAKGTKPRIPYFTDTFGIIGVVNYAVSAQLLIVIPPAHCQLMENLHGGVISPYFFFQISLVRNLRTRNTH
jgi:hypothetical protein